MRQWLVRLLIAVLGTLAVAGCSAINGFVRDVQAVSVPLEVWNRTLDDVTLAGAGGDRLVVAACGHAAAASFRVDNVRVHTDVGYVFGFGVGGTGIGQQYLVIVAADGESFPTSEPPTALPACAGHPNAQPGVFLEP